MEKHDPDSCIFRMEWDSKNIKDIGDRLLRNIVSKVIHEIVIKFYGTFVCILVLPIGRIAGCVYSETPA